MLVGEAIIAHDQRREAVRKSVDASTRLVVGTFIWPYNIEARVDARDGQSVEGRVAETKRCQVVRVRKLLRAWSASPRAVTTPRRALRPCRRRLTW